MDNVTDVTVLSAVRTAGRSGYFGMVEPRLVRAAHKLVRRGLLTRERFSEHVRGEPRFYWWAFRLTDRGMAALEAAGPNRLRWTGNGRTRPGFARVSRSTARALAARRP